MPLYGAGAGSCVGLRGDVGEGDGDKNVFAQQ